jgi:hypothetical protein
MNLKLLAFTLLISFSSFGFVLTKKDIKLGDHNELEFSKSNKAQVNSSNYKRIGDSPGLILIRSKLTPLDTTRRISPNHSFDVGLGFNSALGKDFMRSFSHGINGGLGFRFNLFERTTIIKPFVQFTYFTNDFHEAIMNKFATSEYGLQFGYGPKFIKRKLYFLASISHCSFRDYLSPKEGYKGDDVDLSSGKDFKYSVGIGFHIDEFFIQFEHAFFNPLLHADKGFEDEIKSIDSLYEVFKINPVRLNLNQFSISINYNINFPS